MEGEYEIRVYRCRGEPTDYPQSLKGGEFGLRTKQWGCWREEGVGQQEWGHSNREKLRDY